jgi:hypothetical protein
VVRTDGDAFFLNERTRAREPGASDDSRNFSKARCARAMTRNFSKARCARASER